MALKVVYFKAWMGILKLEWNFSAYYLMLLIRGIQNIKNVYGDQVKNVRWGCFAAPYSDTEQRLRLYYNLKEIRNQKCRTVQINQNVIFSSSPL